MVVHQTKFSNYDFDSQEAVRPEQIPFHQGFEAYRFYCSAYFTSFVPFNAKVGNFPLGEWIAYKRLHSTPKQKKLLSSLGMIWNLQDYKFSYYLSLLQDYVNEYGNALVPPDFIYKDEPLGNWVRYLRLNRNTLCEERVNALNELNFIWNKHDYIFEQNLKVFLLLSENGITITSNTCYGDVKIGLWLFNLTHGRIKLDSAKMDILKKYNCEYLIMEDSN